MTGDEGQDDDPAAVVGQAGDTIEIDRNLIGRLRAQLTLMQGQVRRLSRALLHEQEASLDADPLADLRDLARRLEESRRHLRDSERLSAVKPGGQGPIGERVAEDRLSPMAARSPVRYIVVDVGDDHLRALIASGHLAAEDIDNGTRVAEAIQRMLDHWLRPRASSARTSETMDVVGAGERRVGRERRRQSPRPNSLLSYVVGSPFDRRKGSDRRAPAKDDPASPETGEGWQPVATPDNLVRIDEVRVIGKSAKPRRREAIPTAAVDEAPAPFPPRAAAALASATAVLGQDARGIEGERQPNAGEGDQVRGRERLAIGEDGEQKLAGRRDVLQEADGSQLDAAGAGDEQQER